VAQNIHNQALETPKPGDARLARCQTHLMATPQQSLEAAAQAARDAGLNAYILSDEIEGESVRWAKYTPRWPAARQTVKPRSKPLVSS
jgi:glycerate-2-kinase